MFPVVLIVFTALPLAYIHVEDMMTRSLVCDNTHPYKNLHLFIHEIFFAYFNNKTDHVNSPCFEIVSKDAETPDKGISDDSFLPGPDLNEGRFLAGSGAEFLFDGIRPRALSDKSFLSGLSPPSA